MNHRSGRFDKFCHRSYHFDRNVFIQVTTSTKGTTNGTLFGYYSYNQLFKASGSATLHVEDVPNEGPKSLREVVRLQSIIGGQGMLKCDCKGGCKTNRCKCKQAKVLCNSRCHHSGTCDNKESIIRT